MRERLEFSGRARVGRAFESGRASRFKRRTPARECCSKLNRHVAAGSSTALERLESKIQEGRAVAASSPSRAERAERAARAAGAAGAAARTRVTRVRTRGSLRELREGFHYTSSS